MNQDYTIKELTEEEFLPLFNKYNKSIFDNGHWYTHSDVFDENDLKNIENLGELNFSPYKLYLVAFDKNNELAGWTWGTQENSKTFYMVNSAVLEGHRRKGLYSELIKRCVDKVSNKGFQIIYSRHCATNNAVIIPKLQADFIISKMEIDDKYGVLIHLHYYTNENRRKIMDYRSGHSKPDEKIKKIFKL